MHNFKIGDKVSYYNYGILEIGTIECMSSCRKILHLTSGKWIHSISATLIEASDKLIKPNK